MKNLFAVITFAFIVLATAPVVSAASVVCQPIYGGGQSCAQVGNILIEKKVAKPNSNVFVDNLGVNDEKFGPDGTVTFSLRVTNTGGSNLSRVTVKDIFPQFVDFVSGPGSFDAGSKTLTFEITDLGANQSRDFTITGRVVSRNMLPQDQGVTCVVNQATATSNGEPSRDNAQFCIQKDIPTPIPGQPAVPGKGGQPGQPAQPGQVIPPTTKGGQKVFPQPTVTTTPPTGPEMLPLIGLIPSGIFGYFLRKKSIKS